VTELFLTHQTKVQVKHSIQFYNKSAAAHHGDALFACPWPHSLQVTPYNNIKKDRRKVHH